MGKKTEYENKKTFWMIIRHNYSMFSRTARNVEHFNLKGKETAMNELDCINFWVRFTVFSFISLSCTRS